MEEGAFSKDGFLGDDPLGLGRVEADKRLLSEAGMTHAEIGGALGDLWKLARILMGEPLEPVPGVVVDVEEARGHIACPFGHPGIYAKGSMTITHDGGALRVTPLSIHMIRAHGFFGGMGSPFRVDPGDAVELLKRLAPLPAK